MARSLPYGDQRRLEIARALATDPALLALDEPAAGMNASETVALRKLIEKIRGDGVTVLLIEHDMKLVMGLCDRVLVLSTARCWPWANLPRCSATRKSLKRIWARAPPRIR